MSIYMTKTEQKDINMDRNYHPASLDQRTFWTMNYNIVSNACRLSGNVLRSGYNKISSFSPFPISIDTNNYIYDKRGSSSFGYLSQLTTMITSSIIRFFGGIKDMALAIMYKPEAAQAKTEAPAKPEKKEEDTNARIAELENKLTEEKDLNKKLTEALILKMKPKGDEKTQKKVNPTSSEKTTEGTTKAAEAQAQAQAQARIEENQPAGDEKSEVSVNPKKDNSSEVINEDHKKLLEKAKRKLEVAKKLLELVPKPKEEKWYHNILGFRSDINKATSFVNNYSNSINNFEKLCKELDSNEINNMLYYPEGTNDNPLNLEEKILKSDIIDNIKNLIPQESQVAANKIIEEAKLGN